MVTASGRLLKPVLNNEICHTCMVCRRGCPAEVVPEWRKEEASLRGQVYTKYHKKQPVDKFLLNYERVTDNPPCSAACPIQQNTQGYIACIARKDYQGAANIIRETNALPGVLGYICHHPCEAACVRNAVDEPVSIRSLKRFAMTRDESSRSPLPATQKLNSKVIIVGSGPAGLAAAYDLVRMDYQVEILEKDTIPGGMLRWAIPDFRLPREVLAKDINYLNKLGVVIKTGVVVGADVPLSKLMNNDVRAVIVATGTHKSLNLGVQNENKGKSIDCLSFLRQYANNEPVKLGKKVAVIGGGNAAIDSARTALLCGAKEVQIVYRRSSEEMPADRAEIKEAEDEGVKFSFLTMPLEFVKQNGQWQLKCIKTKLGKPDAQGRRKPLPIKGSEFILDTDDIIVAVGQQPDLSWNKGKVPLKVSTTNKLTVNGSSMTNIKGIFACGDAVTGPTTVVEAMASGKKAAMAVEEYLSNTGADRD